MNLKTFVLKIACAIILMIKLNVKILILIIFNR